MNKVILIAIVPIALALGCATHRQHAETHRHGPNCGHQAIRHDGHVDYLHDGHLHATHSGHSDEHVLAVNSATPAKCTPNHSCASHNQGHKHAENCGHEQVPHGDHTDYLVAGHLHHACAGHCDDHGKALAAK